MPIADLPGFDVIDGFPIDTMHQLFEGLVKRLLGATLEPDSRAAGADEDLAAVNELMEGTGAPSEQPRRPRDLSIARWKASEFAFFAYHVAPAINEHEALFADPDKR